MAKKRRRYIENPRYSMDLWGESHTRDELLKYRQKLAKEANEAIRGLRSHRSQITGRYLSNEKTGAYSQIAKPYLKSRKKSYFNKGLEQTMNLNELKHEIDVLQGFLNSKTYNVEGWENVISSRVEKFVEKGIPRNIAEDRRFYDFLNSTAWDEAVKHFPQSKDVIDSIVNNMSDKMSARDIVKVFDKWLNSERISIKGLANEFKGYQVK